MNFVEMLAEAQRVVEERDAYLATILDIRSKMEKYLGNAVREVGASEAHDIVCIALERKPSVHRDVTIELNPEILYEFRQRAGYEEARP